MIYQIYIGNTKYQARKKEYITNLIKSNTSIYQIPQIFNCGESEEFNYLVSEYKDGIEMEKANKDTFDYKKFYKVLSDILLKIHSINVGNEYRMDRRKWSRKKDSFASYIESEIKRNINRIQQVLGEKKNILEDIKSKANEALAIIREINNIKPVICWYDINPNNILINQKSNIVGFLDPGGARFSPKEWELAFIKMDLCTNKEEYEYFIKEYEKESKINYELLTALSIIVEIDDMAFQLETNTILPIAFDTNFKEIFTIIR